MYRIIATLAAAYLFASISAQGAAAPAEDNALPDLHWRFVGPLRGGRTAAVAGVADKPDRFYIGNVNGGIWRTDDAGRTWTPIFDQEQTGSIGALVVAPSNPNVVYAGSGEGLQRPDLAVGDGVYKSNDGGGTWTHLGLRDGQQISAIAVDPRNADRLFVAVLGHPYGPNSERGLYRSTNGGASFQRVLYLDENTGAYDVTIDPRDPRVVYATLWAARQAPWEIDASFNIAGSGVFKSADGGTTWVPLASGLPQRIGRAEIAIAPSESRIVYAYATMLGTGAAIYRSDDAGLHFTKRNDSPQIAHGGNDLASITVDPRDPDTVYATDTSTYRSHDGGATFVAIKGAPGDDDYHAIWINPVAADHIILGSDQGATISVDGGRTWSSWYNQPTAEMYHVSADDRFPYWVCGGQQESGSACVRSRGNWGEITERDWHPVGAEEYGYVVPDPLHPGVFFGGKVQRFDEQTGQTQEVSPIAPGSSLYRTVRTLPLAFDPIGRRTLYFGANVVFSSDTGGTSWRAISPDLTRARPGVPDVLGPFESDDPEHGVHRGVVYALAPSHVHEGTIWAGTDDGLVWITRDRGAHWSNVTPPELTPWSKVAQIDASRFDDMTAYVAVNRVRLDDLNPYVYRTRDGGTHWTRIVDGLPKQPVNAVRQDPVRPNLLYAATENGISLSFDGGAHWRALQLNLPHTSVRDVIVHGDDLVVATHGRGFWIVDDVEPLRELAAGASVGRFHLFAPALAYRIRRDTNTDTPLPPEEPSGENPPDGAIFDYALAADAQRVVISVFDEDGRLIRHYASDDVAPRPIVDLTVPSYWEAPFRRLSVIAGMHRFVWDLHEGPPRVSNYDLPVSAVYGATPRVPQGALVPPGRYVVRIDADGQSASERFVVVMDPRVHISTAALAHQYVVAHGICSLLDDVETARLAAVSAGTSAAPATELETALTSLLDVVDGSETAPTMQALAAYADLRARSQRLAGFPHRI